MLKLSLLPDEYLVINDSIVVQLSRVAGGRADLAIDAPKSVPIVRGAVLERNGGMRQKSCGPSWTASSPPSGRRIWRPHDLFRFHTVLQAG